MVDKVIVYRSQGQASVDAMLTSGESFPYIVAIVVAFTVLAISSNFLEKYSFFRRGYNILLLPAVAGLGTLFYLLSKLN